MAMLRPPSDAGTVPTTDRQSGQFVRCRDCPQDRSAGRCHRRCLGNCGQQYINADKYLQDIVRDKRYWEGKRQTIRQREKHMEETIERYQTEIEDLQKSRKDILRKAKEEVEQLMREANARIENTIRSIKEAKQKKKTARPAVRN